MKTPRDILFARHQATAPKLDAIRRSVVGELNNQVTKEQGFSASFVASLLGCSNKLWQEIFWPCRRIWTGLATVWVLIIVVNFSQRDNVSGDTRISARSSGAIMSLQAQQRWMNELLADRSLPVEADRPRNFTPKPRTEHTETTMI